jgi:transposase
MAYRYGNRTQMQILPHCIEDYIAENDPVRAYDAFVDALKFNDLGIENNPAKVGNPEYDPRNMLKLFVYGYSYGIKSSRKLERAIHHNLSFIWLMGGLKPEFRRNNKASIQKVLKQSARMCIKLNLIAGNTLFVDGTKIRANASAGRSHEKTWYENKLKELDSRIEQIEGAQKVTERECEIACADAGYADTDELEKLDPKGIKVIVPSQQQALHQDPKPFSKQEFRYDKEEDCYYCPEGHRLNLVDVEKKSGRKRYQIIDRKTCVECRHYWECTTADRGRRITRLRNEEIKEKIEAQYKEETSQEIYKKRKGRCEHPFGHIKRNLKTDSFLLRGRDGVQAETSLLATCFNVARMITLLEIEGLIRKLSGNALACA